MYLQISDTGMFCQRRQRISMGHNHSYTTCLQNENGLLVGIFFLFSLLLFIFYLCSLPSPTNALHARFSRWLLMLSFCEQRKWPVKKKDTKKKMKSACAVHRHHAITFASKVLLATRFFSPILVQSLPQPTPSLRRNSLLKSFLKLSHFLSPRVM